MNSAGAGRGGYGCARMRQPASSARRGRRAGRSGEVHERFLHGSGMEIAQAAENGIEALDVARRVGPDVIVTDVDMPIMDGLSLCRRLRADAATRHVRVVVGHRRRVGTGAGRARRRLRRGPRQTVLPHAPRWRRSASCWLDVAPRPPPTVSERSGHLNRVSPFCTQAVRRRSVMLVAGVHDECTRRAREQRLPSGPGDRRRRSAPPSRSPSPPGWRRNFVSGSRRGPRRRRRGLQTAIGTPARGVAGVGRRSDGTEGRRCATTSPMRSAAARARSSSSRWRRRRVPIRGDHEPHERRRTASRSSSVLGRRERRRPAVRATRRR